MTPEDSRNFANLADLCDLPWPTRAEVSLVLAQIELAEVCGAVAAEAEPMTDDEDK